MSILLALIFMGEIISVGPNLAPPEQTLPFAIEDDRVIIDGCKDWNEPQWSEFLAEYAPSPLAQGTHQYVTPDGSRVDIFNAVYSIEVEWLDTPSKVAEAIGQSLLYSELNANKPGIIFLIKPGTKYKSNYLKAMLVARRYDIQVWVIKVQDHIK